MSSCEITSMGKLQGPLINSKQDQYTIWKILGIWLAGGIPLWIFGWVVHPALSQGLFAVDRGLLWMKLAILGLVWQFVLSMLILYREEGDIRLSTICRRFWLNNPVSPRTGQKDNRLWWLIIPLILLVAALELGLAPFLDDIWIRLFPSLAEPPKPQPGCLVRPWNVCSLDWRMGFLRALCDFVAIQQLPGRRIPVPWSVIA
ncbi:MAG TPA: hypothetical protein VIS72_09560 [Anaerolineales bacterium]